jgi:riboflavin biosynthesis pyrimidine reductase
LLLNRLLPDPGAVDDSELPALFDFGARAPDERPYLVINMVASVDGRVTIDGVSEGLGSEADTAVFFALRASVDAVLAGTGTLKAENYGRLVKKPSRVAQRVALGLEPEPLALVLSRSGNVPRDIPLFADDAARPLVLTGDEADPARALWHVRTEHGVRSVLCEGGPSLNAGLLEAGLVDELFLTVSPTIVGGTDLKTIVEGTGTAAGLELVWTLEAGGFVFLRYRVRR